MQTHLAPPIDTAMQYPTCEGCDRLMRPYGTRKEDHPGTVNQGTRKFCASCRQAQREGRASATRQNITTGTPCLGCRHPLRPKGTKLSAHPGTVAHQAGGCCAPCYKDTAAGIGHQKFTERAAANRAAARMADPPANLSGKDLTNRNNLDRYFAGRRGRQIPPEGIPLDVWRRRAMVTS